MIIPKGFVPSEDTNQIVINTESAQGTSFTSMVRLQKQLNEIVARMGTSMVFARASAPAGNPQPATPGRSSFG